MVDALVLGTSALCMGVRVPPLAPDSDREFYFRINEFSKDNYLDTYWPGEILIIIKDGQNGCSCRRCQCAYKKNHHHSP